MQSEAKPTNQQGHPNTEAALGESCLQSRLGVLVKIVISRTRLTARVLAGKIYNLAGIPGLVHDCDYDAGITKAHIRVRAKELFTIVTVNGLDIYFHRLTGKIDGVGFTSCYMSDSAHESALVREQSAAQHQPVRTNTQ